MTDATAHTTSKIFHDLTELRRAITALGPRTTVCVKGVYDLLHAGHLRSFENAATLADVLIVAVNDDSAVTQRKGRGRPVMSLRDRVYLISGLECVDFVTVYRETSPYALLQALGPTIFAASHFASMSLDERTAIEDHTRLVVVPKDGELSTSMIIERLRQL